MSTVGKENNLTQAYIELNRYCQNGDYERALKAAGKVLQISPNEQKAFHCKVVCLIHLQNFKEALDALTSPKHAALATDLVFEKAYAQYRLNCPRDALQTIDAAPELTPALKELRAQALYRLERYEECHALYREVARSTVDEYEEEREANAAAALVYCGDGAAAAAGERAHTYELCYNLGARQAARGRWAEALATLRRAERLAEAAGEGEGGECRVQQARCLQALGREREAAALYGQALREARATRRPDAALVAVASNNLVALNRDTNLFDSRKRMRAAQHPDLAHRLTATQRATVLYNRALLALHSNQAELCKQCCVQLSREFGDTRRATLVEASVLARSGAWERAVELLARDPDLALAAVQVALEHGDHARALALLAAAPPRCRNSAAALGLQCVLLAAGGADGWARASDLLAEALGAGAPGTGAHGAAVWRAAAAVHARAGRPERQAAAHAALAEAAPGDERELARLVKCLARADPARARSLAAGLPPVAALEGKIDVEALEASSWMMGAKVVRRAGGGGAGGSPGTPHAARAPRPRRRRPARLPPGADLSRAPDPERWLPRHERAAFRRRRGLRRDLIKGSQGLATAAAEQFDMSKQVAAAAAEGAAGSAGAGGARDGKPTPDGGRQQPRTKQQYKKKGKGRKW